MKRNQVGQIPTLIASLETAQSIPDCIAVILDKGKYTRYGLANSLGITQRQLYKWERGICAPREPIITLTVISWAKLLRHDSEQSSLS